MTLIFAFDEVLADLSFLAGFFMSTVNGVMAIAIPAFDFLDTTFWPTSILLIVVRYCRAFGLALEPL